jgi:hypothetical protein
MTTPIAATIAPAPSCSVRPRRRKTLSRSIRLSVNMAAARSDHGPDRLESGPRAKRGADRRRKAQAGSPNQWNPLRARVVEPLFREREAEIRIRGQRTATRRHLLPSLPRSTADDGSVGPITVSWPLSCLHSRTPVRLSHRPSVDPFRSRRFATGRASCRASQEYPRAYRAE